MNLPLLLRGIRRHRGLSQQQLADELGLSRSSVANAEAGRQDLPSSRLLVLLEREGLLVSPASPNDTIARMAGQLETMAALLRATEADVAAYRLATTAIRDALAQTEARS